MPRLEEPHCQLRVPLSIHAPLVNVGRTNDGKLIVDDHQFGVYVDLVAAARLITGGGREDGEKGDVRAGGRQVASALIGLAAAMA